MALNTYIVATCLLGLLCLYIYHKLIPVPLPGIPYDKLAARRMFGDVSTLKSRGRHTKDVSPVLMSLAKDLNSPIIQILLTSFMGPYILVDDPREVEDILVRRNREFDRSELTANFFKPMLPASTIAQMTTPALRAQKRLWADVMSTDFLRRVMAPTILGSARELVELWRIKAGEYSGGQTFGPAHDLECTALDAIWTAVLGSKIGVVRREINKVEKTSAGVPDDAVALESAAIIQKVMVYMNEIVSSGHQSTFPVLSSLKLQLTPSYRRFMKVAYTEVSRLMKQSITRFEQRIQTTPTTTDDAGHDLDTCAMDLVLRREILTAKKTNTVPPDPTSNPAMLQELLLLLLGGHDSTTNTLCWFAKFAAMYPSSQTELRDKLNAILGLDGNAPMADQLDKLTPSQLAATEIPYLDAYVEEVFRFSTTAGMITRRAVVDTTILGYRIPKGTDVILNTRVDASHVPPVSGSGHGAAAGGEKKVVRVPEAVRSPSSQAAQGRRVRGGLEGESGKGLGEFEPRRWLVWDEKMGREVFDGYALPALGFGGGLRGCFGKRLAYLELRIMIAVLVLSFEFLPLESGELNSMAAEERIFRRPQVCQVKLRVL